MTLHEYFEENWKCTPYSVVDHTLRINKEPDGTFTFYIHPSNTSGITSDFIVTEHEVRPRFDEGTIIRPDAV